MWSSWRAGASDVKLEDTGRSHGRGKQLPELANSKLRNLK